ncbi:MAG: N-acetyl-gamma-glutamyl-phosphate reductase [Gammaproteobacteria bacterium]|nr:N-acetyl-gamma-glutamyl-phosphate reductase [Gammaproteobacteria bacterium]
MSGAAADGKGPFPEEGQWPVLVLGGSGYVAGEMLRLIAAHPRLELAGAISTSQAGEQIAATFPHLAPAYPRQCFVTLEAAIERLGAAERSVLLSAAPHGASAEIVAQMLDAAESAGVTLTVVDASADFRFADPEAYAAVYGHPHAAPERLADFTCALPEHLKSVETPHAAHPGCFATSMLLGIVPLVATGLVDGEFYVSAVTGSTGAGRTPRDTTHHPLRHNNLFAYQALKHRHSPEVRALTEAATGRPIGLHFAPHSGPFARGIYASIFARHTGGLTTADAIEALAEFYRDAAFVRVLEDPPRMKDIVATNYAAISAAVDGDTVVVHSTVDNLVKGAAGGSIQWTNRLLGLPEHLGLTAPTAGWL